eukprot:gene10698-3319_t
MELLTLNCRGTKIQVDDTFIDASDTLKAYMELVNSGLISECKDSEYYLNCSVDVFNILSDLIFANTRKTIHEPVYNLAQFLNIDIELEIKREYGQLNNYIIETRDGYIGYDKKNIFLDMISDEEADDRLHSECINVYTRYIIDDNKKECKVTKEVFPLIFIKELLRKDNRRSVNMYKIDVKHICKNCDNIIQQSEVIHNILEDIHKRKYITELDIKTITIDNLCNDCEHVYGVDNLFGDVY